MSTRENKNIKVIALEIILVLLAISLVGITYSFFQVEVENSGGITGEAAALSLNLTVSRIAPTTSKKLIPQLDSAITSAVTGRNGSCIDDNNNAVCQVYKITVKNTSGVTIFVDGTLELSAGNNPNLKWAEILNPTTTPTLKSEINSHTVTTLTENEEYAGNAEKNYYIVVWISETGQAQFDSGAFSGVVTFGNAEGEGGGSGGGYEQIDNSNANAPGYVENLVPVMYDTTTSKWVTADTTSSTSTYGWYDYDARKWANAVLVNDTKRASLTKDASGNYTPGQAIGDTEEEGVLAFYVWIPRYKYKVWNINKVVGTDTYDAETTGIDIVFEDGTETTGGITCTYSYAAPSSTAGSPNEVCTDSGTEGYYTHPAFTFGSDPLTGFWVGKFEISSTDQTASNYGGGTSTTLMPRVLPNVISWRDNPVSNFWLVTKNMQASSNIYGISTDTTILDTHMLTNMEWGAVAYLTHSIYGRCDGTSCTEVAKNDSGDGTTYYTNYTGRSSGVGSSSGYSESGTYTYTEANGQLASTTGNIYGVYDMSGGAYEYVMGNVSSTADTYTYNASSAGSNYTYSDSTAKYLIPYANGSSYADQTAYNRGRLGDATSEVVNSTGGTGAWYSDYSSFLRSSHPWFVRGDGFYDSSNAGVFAFRYYTGTARSLCSARASLAVLVR